MQWKLSAIHVSHPFGLVPCLAGAHFSHLAGVVAPMRRREKKMVWRTFVDAFGPQTTCL